MSGKKRKKHNNRKINRRSTANNAAQTAGESKGAAGSAPVKTPAQKTAPTVAAQAAVRPAVKPAAGLPRLMFFYLLSAYGEVVFRALTQRDFFGPGLFVILGFAIPSAFALNAITQMFGRRANYVITAGVFTISSIVCCAHVIYEYIFGTYFIVYSVLHGGQAFSFYKDIFNAMGNNIPSLLLLLLPAIVAIFWSKRLISFERRRIKKASRYLAGAALSYCLCLLALPIFGTEQFTPYDMYYNSSDVIFSMNRLGVDTTLKLDIMRTVTGFVPEAASEVLESIPPAPPEVPHAPKRGEEGEEDTRPGAVEPTVPHEEVVYRPNILNIDFDALIANETDDELLEMHRYFSEQAPTMTNDKTGLFKDCNVIFIVAEGFSHYVVDKERTPTLYKMATEGLEFTNFYTPIWSVSTSDGEYVAAQGLIPKSGVWSFYKSYENLLPFVLGRQLPRLGYSAYAYHDHSNTYYKRNLSHPNMGYDFKAVGLGLDMTESWPESDLEMIDITTDEYMNSQPFHAYYMTVSGHLNYSFTGNNMSYRNREIVADLPYSEQVRAYLACNYELEKAMTLLLERLEQAGALENTVIVISADHYPYGLDMESFNEIAGHEVDPDFELYRNQLIIYKAGTPHEVVDEPASSLDILPTVSNLLGLPFDSRLLMGRDIFSDVEPLIIFSNRSFITRDARYNTVTGELTANEGVELPDGYRKYWSAVINSKFTYSAKILDRDYYRVLFGDYNSMDSFSPVE